MSRIERRNGAGGQARSKPASVAAGPAFCSQIIGFNNSFPIVANRKVDATLRVRDGETIVLGGLFEDVDSETVTKLPILGDLPVLGSFFRNRQSSHTKDEVVFFITPRILSADGR
ncbi:MAG: hypothetical protein JWN27_2963 [Candidatus Eremiobacteraeota bacterium]|nr:hypothetical protein [Candidatus Eremiobacteraeota bacterium]